MTLDEMNTLIGQALEQDDRAERSTVLDNLRTEVSSLYQEKETLTNENTELKDKNSKLVEANSQLFMKVSFEDTSKKDSEKNQSESFDIKKMLK